MSKHIPYADRLDAGQWRSIAAGLYLEAKAMAKSIGDLEEFMEAVGDDFVDKYGGEP